VSILPQDEAEHMTCLVECDICNGSVQYALHREVLSWF